MSEQEKKGQRAVDLLRTQVDPKVITTQIKISLITVYNIRKAMEGMDPISRKPGTGRHNKKRKDIKKDPTKSMSKMAAERNVAPITVNRALCQETKASVDGHHEGQNVRETKKVLYFFKHNGDTVKIYSDKKIFTVDAVLKEEMIDSWLKQEVRWRVLQDQTSSPSHGPGHHAPTLLQANEKVNSDVYYKVLRYKVLPWLKSTFPRNNYEFTQDRAPAQTSMKVQEFCKGNMESFWPAELWPSSSPDVNPLDFATNKTSHPSIEATKATITKEWDNMSEDFIKTSCASVRPRIEAIIRNNEGHIE
ncbi:Uncharacterized protein FKW44_012871 [Caligus rogercresseyi]|uniref:Uncharacterized protein n=1 Tax=Caligus rogercresseyi TaxID=217165 RepID=A0A7T8KB34_CALRO|nr:Uncharacterized protein FKW44_012871 [Caligus rogercresseyi]